MRRINLKGLLRKKITNSPPERRKKKKKKQFTDAWPMWNVY
jgi:hypothetical protein